MTVGELKSVLVDMDDNLQILLQTDPEGNGYHQLRGIVSDGFICGEDKDAYMIDNVYLEDELESEEVEDAIRVAIVFP